MDVVSVVVACFRLFLVWKVMSATMNFSWIILLVVYGVDSVMTILHRLQLHENIGLPHRKHLYQIMANELHMPHVWVSIVYMVVQAAVVAGFIACNGYGSGAVFVLCYCLGCVLVGFIEGCVLFLLYSLFVCWRSLDGMVGN